MSERLTNKELAEKLENGYFGDINFQQAVYIKLYNYENLMEKYGIDLEELDETLDDNKYSKQAFTKLLKECQNTTKDRDTWKKACELACESLNEMYCSYEQIKQEFGYNANEFYQQAQKGGKTDDN